MVALIGALRGDVMLLRLECPPKSTGVFAGHLTQVSCMLLQPYLPTWCPSAQREIIAQVLAFLELMRY